MSVRRVGWVAALALATLLEISCGQVYRPVVIPVSITPPNPANFHAVFGINANVPSTLGTALQIDVSGDSEIGVANMGINPTHAAILPNNSRVFVASAGSLFTGEVDVVTAFFPANDSSVATGLGTPTTYTFPNVGPINPATGVPYACSFLPDFVATSQTNAVYVSSYGVENDPACNLTSTDSIAALNPALNNVSNLQYLPAGTHPVGMVETPNALNLYVLSQGTNTVLDLSPTDLSTIATIPVGSFPTWAVSRLDGQRVYVVTQGDGKLYTIDTTKNAQIPGSPQSLGGAGADYIQYDKSRNRLYATNPNAGAVYVFDATTDPPTPLGSATGAVSIPAPPIPACAGCSYSSVMPTSVAALPDGSRFYVSSYVTAAAGSPCPDANITAAGCVIPQVTVFDAGTLAVKTTVFPLLPTVQNPPLGQPFALAPVAFCAPVIPYSPASSRFRMSAAAAADSTRVYTSLCDGGSVAIVNTTTSTISVNGNTPDTLVTDLLAPFSAATATNGEPPPQNPVFLLSGQ